MPTLGYHDEAEVAWTVEAERPVAGPFRVALGGAR